MLHILRYFIWFIKNLIINIFVSMLIMIWTITITKKFKIINCLLLITNLVFELSKAFLLIGMFDIDDLIIRIITCYIIYKVWSNKQR